MRPGLGMFNESYYIFSVGNVKPIWREQYPSCWKVRPGKQCVQSQPTPVARLALPVCSAPDACTCRRQAPAPAAASCADAQLLNRR